MDLTFWKSKQGRWTIIGLAYVIIYGVFCVVTSFMARQLAEAGSAGDISGATSFSFVVVILFIVAGWPIATNVINKLNNAIFGRITFLFGPLEMFIEIFLVKLLLRIFIAMFVGPVLLPYNVGKFIANKVAEM